MKKEDALNLLEDRIKLLEDELNRIKRASVYISNKKTLLIFLGKRFLLFQMMKG